jgi:hypothetical protein
MKADGVRVYVLARELRVEAADVLAAAKPLGIDLKTQLSLVSPEGRAALEAYFRDRPPRTEQDQGVPTLGQLFGR